MKRKFDIGDFVYDNEGGCGTIIDITDTHYVCDTMTFPIKSQDEYKSADFMRDPELSHYEKNCPDYIKEIKENILNNALDFILETQEDNDYICEMNGEWCETHCIDTLRKGCIIHYLNDVYGKDK